MLVVAYQFLVQGPLSDVLKRRRALTEGAVEDAQKAIAEAEARAADYASKLRQARAEATRFANSACSSGTRNATQLWTLPAKPRMTRQARPRRSIEAEAEAARISIQSSAGELAGQVVRAVLPVGAGGTR